MRIVESPEGSPTLTRQALSGTAWSSVTTAGRQILTLASVATVARILGPRAYGVMGMANLLIVFILNFRDLGTGSAIIQRKNLTSALLSSLFWVNFSFGFLLSLLVAVTSPLMAKFFKTPELVPILCVLGVSFWLISCGITHNSLLVREMRFRALAAVDLTAAVTQYLVALTLAYNGYGVWALVYANLANSVMTSTGYWIAANWRPSWQFALGEVKSIAKYSLNLSGFAVVNYFSRNADNITVGKVLGQAPLGAYQMAYNLMLAPIQNISSVIAQATFPAFARIQDDDERFRAAYTRSCMLIALISFPVLAGMGVVADPLIRTVIGNKWVAAIPVFQILAPVGIFQSIYTTVGLIFMAKTKTDILFQWGVVSSSILVASFLIGIRWGILGVATAYCIAFIFVTMIPGFLIAFKLIDLRLPKFALALTPQFAITALMAAVCWLWMRVLPLVGTRTPWVQLFSTVVLGVATYALLLLTTWPPVMYQLESALISSGRPFFAHAFAKAKTFRQSYRGGGAQSG
jgi:O-antigen/teichoic acid export membrane protein